MSCFIMREDSIAALSEFTADLLNFGFTRYGFSAPEELAKALSDCRDFYHFFDSQKIYKRLYALNVAAYNGRYGRYERAANGESSDLDSEQAPEIKTSDYCIHDINGGHKLAPWHFRIVKLLACYNYQIAEDVTAKHPLTTALKGLEHQLNSFIVIKSPEWEAAPSWGKLYEAIEQTTENDTKKEDKAQVLQGAPEPEEDVEEAEP